MYVLINWVLKIFTHIVSKFRLCAHSLSSIEICPVYKYGCFLFLLISSAFIKVLI